MGNPVLQPDTLERIFSYLDGKSLQRSMQVCSIWRDVIKHVSVNTKVWRHCCEEEIPEDVLIDITTNIYPFWKSSSVDTVNWKTVYTSWNQWRNVKYWPFMKREVFSTVNRTERITCLRITGSCIITGHVYGGVNAWDCYKSHLGTIVTHMKPITDLGLICFTDKTRIKKSKWNVKHDYVISTSGDHLIKVTPVHENASPLAVLTVHMAPTTTVRVFKNIFVVLGEDDFLSVWQLHPPSEFGTHNNPTLMYKNRVYPDSPQAVSIWRGKLTGITNSAQFFCIPSTYATAGIQNRNLPTDIEVSHTFSDIPSCYILQAYIWKHCICVWLTGRHKMLVAIQNFASRQYNPMAALNSYPVSLLLYGELFLMGMESGTLFMYIVKTPQDLLNLDLKLFIWSHNVSKEPIISMDIADSNTEPIIVAATRQDIYYIALYPLA